MTPQTIGRYEIESELTHGGMGVIFLARDPFIQRQVVVKVLMYQRALYDVYRDFFQREAEVIAPLEHPAIVPVYDFAGMDNNPTSSCATCPQAHWMRAYCKERLS